jgi:hypothetical protein
MRRRDFFSLPAVALGFSPVASASGSVLQPVFNSILDYGARPDGKTKNTEAIQRAIEAAFRNGGGLVYVPPGVFLTGGIVLRSGVTLHLEAGAILRASTDFGDYTAQPGPPWEGDANGHHLIFARDAANVAITGLGVIDGQGQAFWTRTNRNQTAPEDLWRDVIAYDWKPNQRRPSPLLEFAYCKNLRIEGVTLTNAPGWTLRPVACDSVFIHGIRVRNPVYGPNSDGIDITSSRNVFVSDCDIDCGDDAICLKSENPYGENLPNKNITITNCVLTSCCNGFKMGTATHGAFENIVFSNSVIYNNDVPLNERVIAGIAVEMVDGGSVDGVVISNIRMQNVRTPIFVRLGRRSGGAETSLRNVMIEGLDASGSILTSSITGVPGSRVKDVTLRDVRIRTAEGGDANWVNLPIPENEKDYPEARMFGRLPSYGLYVRHADQIRLHNLELIAEKPDGRPALLCDDVRNVNISGLEASAPMGAESVISLRNTIQAFIHGSRAPQHSALFLRVHGGESAEIALAGNDLSEATEAIQFADGASQASVRGKH